MRLARLGLLGLCVLECGGGSGVGSDCSAKDWKGIFLFKDTEGACGTLVEDYFSFGDVGLVLAPGVTVTANGCRLTSSMSSDVCSADVEVTCAEDSGGTMEMTGVFQRSPEYSDFWVPMTVTTRDANASVQCSGAYDVHFLHVHFDNSE